jgi:hypothetical protein
MTTAEAETQRAAGALLLMSAALAALAKHDLKTAASLNPRVTPWPEAQRNAEAILRAEA